MFALSVLAPLASPWPANWLDRTFAFACWRAAALKSRMLPYYERAQSVMGSGPFAYDAADWEDEAAPQLKFNSDRLQTRIFQFGNGALFFDPYRRKLNQSSNITTLTPSS